MKRLSEVVPAWLLPVVALVLLPNAIYFANPLDFGPPRMLLQAWAAAAALAAAMLLLLALPARARRVAVIAVFWSALFLAVTDVVYPIRIGEVMDMGGAFLPTEYVEAIGVEAAIALGMAVLAVKVPFHVVRGAGTALVLFLLAWQAVYAGARWREVQAEFHTLATAPPAPARATAKANVYHLVFDSFSSYSFLAIAGGVGLEDFAGFTFYPHNRSNYLYTSVSRASFLTGELFQDGELRHWMRREHHGGMFRELYDAGFTTWSYGTEHADAVHTVTRGSFEPQGGAPLHTLLDFALLRLVPTGLQEEVYGNGRGLVTRLLGSDSPIAGPDWLPVSSLKLVERLIADEEARPARAQYVHAHAYLPHFPYRLDPECGFLKGSIYKAQAACSVRLMQRFIRALKAQGKFDEATIVIHADHGTWSDSPALAGREADAALFAPYSVYEVDFTSRALLLIKPPRAPQRALQVSTRQSQLVDLRPTLQTLLGLPRTPGPGADLLAPDFPAGREAHVFPGFLQRDAHGRFIAFGKRIREGTWRHFSVNADGRWTAHPDLRVKW